MTRHGRCTKCNQIFNESDIIDGVCYLCRRQEAKESRENLLEKNRALNREINRLHTELNETSKAKVTDGGAG